jgi:hypothetical protein
MAPLILVPLLDEAREILPRHCARRPRHGLRTDGRRPKDYAALPSGTGRRRAKSINEITADTNGGN